MYDLHAVSALLSDQAFAAGDGNVNTGGGTGVQTIDDMTYWKTGATGYRVSVVDKTGYVYIPGLGYVKDLSGGENAGQPAVVGGGGNSGNLSGNKIGYMN